MMKRMLSLLLAMVLCVGLLPVQVLADTGCTCSSQCVEAYYNWDCPVCGSDWSACSPKQPESEICRCEVFCTDKSASGCNVCIADGECTGKKEEKKAEAICGCSTFCGETPNADCTVCLGGGTCTGEKTNDGIMNTNLDDDGTVPNNDGSVCVCETDCTYLASDCKFCETGNICDKAPKPYRIDTITVDTSTPIITGEKFKVSMTGSGDLNNVQYIHYYVTANDYENTLLDSSTIYPSDGSNIFETELEVDTAGTHNMMVKAVWLNGVYEETFDENGTTVNVLDDLEVSASPAQAKVGDTVTVTAKYNGVVDTDANMSIALNGYNPTTMTKVDDRNYTYSYVVGSSNDEFGIGAENAFYIEYKSSLYPDHYDLAKFTIVDDSADIYVALFPSIVTVGEKVNIEIYYEGEGTVSELTAKVTDGANYNKPLDLTYLETWKEYDAEYAADTEGTFDIVVDVVLTDGSTIQKVMESAITVNERVFLEVMDINSDIQKNKVTLFAVFNNGKGEIENLKFDVYKGTFDPNTGIVDSEHLISSPDGEITISFGFNPNGPGDYYCRTTMKLKGYENTTQFIKPFRVEATPEPEYFISPLNLAFFTVGEPFQFIVRAPQSAQIAKVVYLIYSGSRDQLAMGQATLVEAISSDDHGLSNIYPVMTRTFKSAGPYTCVALLYDGSGQILANPEVGIHVYEKPYLTINNITAKSSVTVGTENTVSFTVADVKTDNYAIGVQVCKKDANGMFIAVEGANDLRMPGVNSYTFKPTEAGDYIFFLQGYDKAANGRYVPTTKEYFWEFTVKAETAAPNTPATPATPAIPADPNGPGTPATPATPAAPARPTTTVTVPVTGEGAQQTVQTTVMVTGNTASVERVDKAEIQKVLTENQTGTMKVDLSQVKEVDTAEIPRTMIQDLLDLSQEDQETVLELELPEGSVQLDNKAMGAILEEVRSGGINVSVKVEQSQSLNRQQQEAVSQVEVHGVARISVTRAVNNRPITDLKEGRATMAIPFEIPAGKQESGFSIWKVDEKGNMVKLETRYENGKLVWDTDEMADFVIVYQEPTAASAQPVAQNEIPVQEPEVPAAAPAKAPTAEKKTVTNVFFEALDAFLGWMF